jgi:hypothetical protein
MNDVGMFLWEYRFILILVLAVVLYAITQWKEFKSRAYALMLQAKRLAKDAVLKSGDEQVEWIIKRAYQYLPKSVMLFIGESNLRKIIKWLYDKAKDWIDDGQINGSITK